MIYIGLPQWSHPKWVRLGITSLEEYARHFNCVEGNTTLYALTSASVLSFRRPFRIRQHYGIAMI